MILIYFIIKGLSSILLLEKSSSCCMPGLEACIEPEFWAKTYRPRSGFYMFQADARYLFSAHAGCETSNF